VPPVESPGNEERRGFPVNEPVLLAPRATDHYPTLNWPTKASERQQRSNMPRPKESRKSYGGSRCTLTQAMPRPANMWGCVTDRGCATGWVCASSRQGLHWRNP